MKPSAFLAALLAAAVTVACATPPPGQTEPSGLQALSRQALADAALRSGLPASALQVESAEAVTWRNGALGCPQPGVMVTQALVPGYRIRIRAGSAVLSYHAGAGGDPAFCPAALAQAPLAPDLRR